MRARNAEECQLSRGEAVQYLKVLTTPIGEVTVDHRLAQSYDAKSGKIELPNKLGARQLLARMDTHPLAIALGELVNSSNEQAVLEEGVGQVEREGTAVAILPNLK